MTIKKILNTKWVIIIFLLALFPPKYFDQNATVSAMLNVLKLIISIAVTLLYIVNIKKHLKKYYDVLLLILCLTYFISTLLSDDASWYAFSKQAVDLLIPSFLVGAIAIYSPSNGIKAMYYYFSACVLANTIAFILFPGALYADAGGWRCWILGDDNSSYSNYALANTFALIYCSCVKKKTTFLSILVWASGYIFAFGRELGNGIICQMIWTILFIMYHFRRIKELLKARYIFYVTAIGFLGIVVFRNLIIGSIANALGKDITLSGRTMIWDNTVKAIMRRPLLGYGMCDGEVFSKIISKPFDQPHDYILQIMFWGGFIALAVFAFLLIKSVKASSGARKTDFYKCAVIGLIVLSVRLMVDNGRSNHFFVLLTLLNYSPEFAARLGLPEASAAQLRGPLSKRGIITESK